MWMEDIQEWLDKNEPEKPFLPATYLNHHQIQEIFKTFWYDYFSMIQELDTEQKESEEELQKEVASSIGKLVSDGRRSVANRGRVRFPGVQIRKYSNH